MRRTLVLVLTAVLCVSAAAPATAAIKIKRIAFDPAGADSGTNRHLRRELVVIKNTGSRAVRVDGWRLRDRGGDHTYRFGDQRRGDDVFTDIRLRPGEFIRLHTGRGQDSMTATINGHKESYYDFYWDLDNYVWNNDGDRAKLIRPNGNVVDTCAYTATADSPRMC
jgi:hypothetical protein